MKRWNLVLAVFTVVGIPTALVVSLPSLRSHAQEPQEPPILNRGLTKELNDLMRRKLDNSQKILEGIALSDFDTIAKHAEDLIAVSEQAQWQVLETPEYRAHSNNLRRTAAVLIQKSKEKNVDGTVLAYLDLTMTCVKCHKHLRDTR
jgi:hypothetical protein